MATGNQSEADVLGGSERQQEYQRQRMVDEYAAPLHIVEKLLQPLRQIGLRSFARHHMVIAPQGGGKSRILRRVAAMADADEDIAQRVIALLLPPEQHDVHKLFAFWCNCLEALRDAFQAKGECPKALEVDEQLRELRQPKHGATKKGEDAASKALQHLRSWSSREQRRILLLVDNCECVLDHIGKESNNLRDVLQGAGAPVLIAASGRYDAAMNAAPASMRELFVVVVTKPPTLAASCLSLQKMQEASKVERTPLPLLQAQVAAISHLCCERPLHLERMQQSLAAASQTSITDAAEAVLDAWSDQFVAQLAVLTPLARVVFDVTAKHHAPVTAAQVAAISKLPVAVVSAYLDRLIKKKILHKTKTTAKRSAFEVADRAFNIWFLLRYGGCGRRRRLELLGRFICACHSAAVLPAADAASSPQASSMKDSEELLQAGMADENEAADTPAPLQGANAMRVATRLSALVQAQEQMQADNIGAACAALGQALPGDLGELLQHGKHQLRDMLLQATDNNQAEKLLSWLQQQGEAERLEPLLLAWRCMLQGEQIMNDRDVETRRIVIPLLSWLRGEQG